MPQPVIRKFVVWILLYSVAIGLIAAAVFSFPARDYYLPVFPILLLFFAVVNIAFIYLLFAYAGHRPPVFARAFLLGSGIKFFLYIIFLLTYLLASRSHAIPFLFQFISLYFLYTIFEVTFLLKNVKNDRHKDNI